MSIFFLASRDQPFTYLYLFRYAAVLINSTCYYAKTTVNLYNILFYHTCPKINKVLSMHVDCFIGVPSESECSIRVYQSSVAKHYLLC